MSTVRPNLQPPKPPENRWMTEYAIGTVICFAKTFRNSDKQFGYVTLRAADGRWYLTQAANRVTSPMTWEGLIKFIGDSPASIVSEWTTIPQTGSGDLGDRGPYTPHEEDPGVTMNLSGMSYPDAVRSTIRGMGIRADGPPW